MVIQLLLGFTLLGGIRRCFFYTSISIVGYCVVVRRTPLETTHTQLLIILALLLYECSRPGRSLGQMHFRVLIEEFTKTLASFTRELIRLAGNFLFLFLLSLVHIELDARFL
jgi:hypothetical protein